MIKLLALSWALACLPAFAQMTVEQRVTDFQQLVAIYAKQYAPYEWKREAIHFDLLRIGPWLDRIPKLKDDFEFLDLCVEYVSSLKDSHSQFFLPSDFSADSGLFIDWYDGKAIIDGIDRNILPIAQYPFQVGDEIVSVDGKTPAEWISELSKFTVTGNPRATLRGALDLIVYRPQFFYPRASQTPDRSRLIVRLASGTTQAFGIEWVKQGEPLNAIGPVPNPVLRDPATGTSEASSPYDTIDLMPRPYRGPVELRKARVRSLRAVSGIGSLSPLFDLPSGFQQRLGRPGRDLIFSGVFQSAGLRIGFLRMGDFFDPNDPFTSSTALSQLISEIAFMDRNTDGLVVDIMHNPGGDVCFAQDAASLMMRQPFSMPGAQIRATREWIIRYENLADGLEAQGSEPWVVNLVRAFLGDIRGAYSANRASTGALPICDISLTVEAAQNRAGTLIGYSKPIMLLVDELTASAAEIFASAIQDNDRGIVFGTPTMGAGGTISNAIAAGNYAETTATVTQSQLVRSRRIASPDYPTSAYIENIGIRPDIGQDIMTKENLLNSGRPFVQAFQDAMVKYLQQ